MNALIFKTLLWVNSYLILQNCYEEEAQNIENKGSETDHATTQADI